MFSDHLRPAHQRVLVPEEIAILQHVFDRTCVALGIEKKSRQAEGLAATLFTLHERGVRSEDQLEAMVALLQLREVAYVQLRDGCACGLVKLPSPDLPRPACR